MAPATKSRSVFGDILRDALDQQGRTIRDLSRLLADEYTEAESKRRMLQRYIAGEIVPSERVRHEIADALGLPRERFAEDREHERAIREVHSAMLPLAEALLNAVKPHQRGQA